MYNDVDAVWISTTICYWSWSHIRSGLLHIPFASTHIRGTNMTHFELTKNKKDKAHMLSFWSKWQENNSTLKNPSISKQYPTVVCCVGCLRKHGPIGCFCCLARFQKMLHSKGSRERWASSLLYRFQPGTSAMA